MTRALTALLAALALVAVACHINPAQANALCTAHLVNPHDPILYAHHEHATGFGGEQQSWVACAARAVTNQGGIPAGHYYIFDIRTDTTPDRVSTPADYGTTPPPIP